MLNGAAVTDRATRSSCAGGCEFRGATNAHHDRLLTVDRDLDAVMELLELAVTWGELDYSTQPVIGPSRWSLFLNAHAWVDRARAEQVFSLANDVALHSQRAGSICGRL